MDSLKFEQEQYDLEGLIRMADNIESPMVLMFSEEDDERYQRNRYEVLESHRGIEDNLRQIERYLEYDEWNGLFIGFAASYKGKMIVLNGQRKQYVDLDLGDLELGENTLYGMLIHLEEGVYYFEEMIYTDGGDYHQSYAEEVFDAKDLSGMLEEFISQFE